MSAQKWEYRLFNRGAGEVADDAPSALSEEELEWLGEAGWELISAVIEPPWGTIEHAILKRPKVETKEAPREVVIDVKDVDEAVERCGALAEEHPEVCYVGIGADVLMGYVAMALVAISDAEIVREFPIHEFDETPGGAVNNLEATVKRALESKVP